MKKIATFLFVGAIALATAVTQVGAVSSFFNGFETDTDGWFSNGGVITRVASGTNGVPSADCSYHAEVEVGADFTGVFTRWGGYESVFPSNGYVTEVDVYLDTADNSVLGTDDRFDYSSAVNDPGGNHRRDFIFSVGTDPLVTGQFAVSSSNNAPGWPSDPARDPLFIDTTGWYTFSHTFQDDGSGVLEVIMEVKDSSGTVLDSWTLSDSSDVIGTTVGGNRYGWFVTSDFPMLEIDNSSKEDIVPVVNPPADKEGCKDGGWQASNNPEFKNQGDCISYVTANENASGNR